MDKAEKYKRTVKQLEDYIGCPDNWACEEPIAIIGDILHIITEELY